MTGAQHAEALDREQAEGDLAEELADRWREVAEIADLGLPLEPPPSPEDEETLPTDPERTAA